MTPTSNVSQSAIHSNPEDFNQSQHALHATHQMKTICDHIQKETAADTARYEGKLAEKEERLAELMQRVLQNEERLAKV